MLFSLSCTCTLARNKDNSWPEELIAVMKEVEKDALSQEQQVVKELKNQGKLHCYVPHIHVCIHYTMVQVY